MTLLTAHELCDSLHISRSTLHRLKKVGLPSIGSGRLARFDGDKVLGWYDQYSHLIHAPDMLAAGIYQCRGCHYEATVPEPTDATRLGPCRRCGSRERPIRVDVPAV